MFNYIFFRYSSVIIGTSLLLLNGIMVFDSVRNRSSDWVLLANIFGTVFSVRILYNWYALEQKNKRQHREFISVMNAVKPKLDSKFEEIMHAEGPLAEKMAAFDEVLNEIVNAEFDRRKNHSSESNSDKP